MAFSNTKGNNYYPKKQNKQINKIERWISKVTLSFFQMATNRKPFLFRRRSLLKNLMCELMRALTG